jgi:hypothetical protein
MAGDQSRGERLLAWASGREQRKGLRPRDAAILIICVWFLAIVGGLMICKPSRSPRFRWFFGSTEPRIRTLLVSGHAST